MDNEPKSDLEQSFQQRQEALYDFYQSDKPHLSNDDVHSLTPIYNSLLETVESRYAKPLLIAEGGEKRIFKTYDKRLDRFVAMAYAARANTQEEQERFLREARLTANLIHPNIVPIHNMGIDAESKPFFSMELVSGDSLKDILDKLRDGKREYHVKYTLDVLLGIYLKVCDAIAYAHSREVLHLDIKPDNIRVGQFGEVLVCDWGLARVIHEEEAETPPGQLDADVLNDMTLSGTMKGTPGFMAPEQTLHSGEKTPQTDIYALGALLYKILTHEIPVSGKSANEVVENTRTGNIIPPRKRRPDALTPKGPAAVAMKALQLNPADRYQTVLALQAEIKRYQSGFPTRAECAGVKARLTLFTQRHRELTLWILAFFVVLSGVVSVNLLVIQKKKQEAENARLVAEQNFELYLKKEAEAEMLDAALGEASILTSKSLDVLHPAARLKLLNKIDLTGMKPSEVGNILQRRADLEFMLQRFNAAARTYEQLEGDSEIRELLDLAVQYGHVKTNDKNLLTDGGLAQLLTHRDTIKQDMAYPIYHYHITRRHKFYPGRYMPLASIMLGRVNGVHDDTIVPLKLSRQKKGWHLDLSGTPYTTYSVPIAGSYRRNILQPLDLYSLDISHSRVGLVKELANLKINELRMVGVKLEPRDGLPAMLHRMGVKKVVLGRGEYPEAVIAEIAAGKITVEQQEPES